MGRRLDAIRNLTHAREGSGWVRDAPSHSGRLAGAEARHRFDDERDRREDGCRQERALPRARHDLEYRWSRRPGAGEPVLAWVHLPTASLYGIGGGLVEVLGRDWHDVILRRDGSVFAEPTPPPTTGYAAFGVNLANSLGTRVAYEIVNESSSRATVYLLRAGETPGTPVL